MSLDEITILYVVIAFLVGLIIKSYLPAYMSKKGENLATKEDIGEITRKLESVKSVIEIQKDSHMGYIGERKNALLAFYDEVTTFQYELIAVSFGDFPFDEGKSLYAYQKQFYSSVAQILKCYQRLVIYLAPESDILKYANNITTSVIGARKVVKEKFGNIKSTAIAEQMAYLAMESKGKSVYEEAAQEANEANSSYWDAMSTPVDTFIKNYRKYLTALNNEFQAQQLQA